MKKHILALLLSLLACSAFIQPVKAQEHDDIDEDFAQDDEYYDKDEEDFDDFEFVDVTDEDMVDEEDEDDDYEEPAGQRLQT